VKVEASADGRTWHPVMDIDIPKDRRVTLARPVEAPHLRFTFTSHSGTLLILPDVEFIKEGR